MRKRPILVHGHRGARGVRPENTLEAFRYAIAAGVDAIELDVNLSRAGVPLVCHDPPRRRANSIPALDEVLALAPAGDFLFNIELKPHRESQRVAEIVVPLVEPLASRVMIQSFDFKILAAVRRQNPTLTLGALFYKGSDFAAIAQCAQAQIAVPRHTLITQARVVAAHQSKIPVYTWTVNQPAQWTKMLEAKVDAIITDDPAALIEFLKNRPA